MDYLSVGCSSAMLPAFCDQQDMRLLMRRQVCLGVGWSLCRVRLCLCRMLHSGLCRSSFDNFLVGIMRS